MNIIAVDPGKVCGVAYLDQFRTPWAFKSWERKWWTVTVNHVEQLVGCDALDLVACESFVPRPGVRTWQPDALETIGALRYVCQQVGVPFELQPPGDAKWFSTNAKLTALGWRNPTPGGHADDAARHLLLAAVRHGVIDPAQFTT